mgnify:CR=1 FL=1
MFDANANLVFVIGLEKSLLLNTPCGLSVHSEKALLLVADTWLVRSFVASGRKAQAGEPSFSAFRPDASREPSHLCERHVQRLHEGL